MYCIAVGLIQITTMFFPPLVAFQYNPTISDNYHVTLILCSSRPPAIGQATIDQTVGIASSVPNPHLSSVVSASELID